MLHVDQCGVCVMPPETTATNATHLMVFDTKGFDRANVYLGMATHVTSLATLSTLKFTEGTNTACSDAIVALTGGTSVVADSTGFVIPTAAKMGIGDMVEFQIDLKARKRYMKLSVTPGDTTARESYGIALLSRPGQSKDTAVKKYVKNYGDATNSTSVALLVSG